ncbi:MAG: hypothetical protein ACO4CG_09220 [Prochlorothrix sp.]
MYSPQHSTSGPTPSHADVCDSSGQACAQPPVTDPGLELSNAAATTSVEALSPVLPPALSDRSEGAKAETTVSVVALPPNPTLDHSGLAQAEPAPLPHVDHSPWGDCHQPEPVYPALADSPTIAPKPYRNDRWSSLRFRRAKDSRGWALLGIPNPLYPLVIQRLFEEKAKFIAKHADGGFVSLLFEAPPTLAATLALTFPAPPGCAPLVINESGSRILAGQAAKSTRAQYQICD